MKASDLRKWTQGGSNPDLMAASYNALNGVLCSKYAGHERAEQPKFCAVIHSKMTCNPDGRWALEPP